MFILFLFNGSYNNIPVSDCVNHSQSPIMFYRYYLSFFLFAVSNQYPCIAQTEQFPGCDLISQATSYWCHNDTSSTIRCLEIYDSLFYENSVNTLVCWKLGELYKAFKR